MTYHEYFGYLLVLDGSLWRLVGSAISLVIFGFGLGYALRK